MNNAERHRARRSLLFLLFPALSLWFHAGCSEEEPDRSGSFSLLTYNVAGLPQGISGSNPEANMPQISPLLNDYDVVLVQEDFWYHDVLCLEAGHPFQSEPWSDRPDLLDIGDGLNRFSQSSFGETTRMSWPDCNGTTDCASDCMASKGFRFATHELAEGVFVDIYNVHMEAGGCPEDEVIRADSIQLLLDTFPVESPERAIIVAGDWNLHEEDAVDLGQLRRLVDEGGFQDACWALDCGATNIDRVFYRGSSDLELSATSWTIPGEFVDEAGEDLSDHEPVAVVIEWQERR